MKMRKFPRFFFALGALLPASLFNSELAAQTTPRIPAPTQWMEIALDGGKADPVGGDI